jgi:hypothetical protein
VKLAAQEETSKSTDIKGKIITARLIQQQRAPGQVSK